ncbi:hypothetical protein [Sphingobium sp. UBA5915]|uniref:hypothetical protein n=1 Tax=Sphingobium sp. UBA5915 TaxID=1947530 RepID=UPI0025F97752|nr:hypothetical protein [Sphingobium sp. UBA5915]
MGKTLGNIITIGAAVAVNFVPGVGQALSGALIGTLGAVGSALYSGLTVSLAAAGIQSAGSLVGLGPNLDKPQTSSVSLKPRPHGSNLFEGADDTGISQ